MDILDEQKVLSLDVEQLRRLVVTCLLLEGERCDEVALHFVEKERMGELHQRFFDDPEPTDCISLPMDEEEVEGYRHLGDLFVCPEVAREYGESHGEDPYREVMLYVVHGLLHLMGYEDREEEEILVMREAERRHMEKLQILGIHLMSSPSQRKEFGSRVIF